MFFVYLGTSHELFEVTGTEWYFKFEATSHILLRVTSTMIFFLSSMI